MQEKGDDACKCMREKVGLALSFLFELLLVGAGFVSRSLKTAKKRLVVRAFGK